MNPVVVAEIRDRFSPPEAEHILQLFQSASLPLLDGPLRERGRARVQLAVLKLSGGDLTQVERWLREAELDWRDVLVASGLEHADWDKVLASAGFRVP
jgi:hypothetical protein